MATNEYQPTRVFTVEEANATLPLVRAITNDLATLAQEVVERRERLAVLDVGRSPNGQKVYSEEVAQIASELDSDTQALQDFVDELRQLGVEPKGALDGLVDFPAMLDGRVVFLCWKLGEPQITHWHELEGGFAGRQPISTLRQTPVSPGCP